MPSNYRKDDPVFGTIDLDDAYVTDSWLVDKFVGGTLFGWAGTGLGVGQGNTAYYSSPIQIGSLTNWKSVTSIVASMFGIKYDGTLWYWGAGGNGQSGLGFTTNSNYSSPVQVGALTNWKQISGAYHGISVKTDGTLWAWGDNFNGRLGLGNVSNAYSSPVQVGALNNWKQVSGGYYFSSAIKYDGTLWTWGQNMWGQLGNGNTTYYSSPIQVGSLTNWKYVACTTGHYGLAIKTDGTLWAWGGNFFGGLGINNTTYYSSPVQVGTLNNWKYVYTSFDHSSYAIKTDGTLWAWGQNEYGQLGLGNTAYYSSPVQIGTLTNWKHLSAGGGGSPASVLAVKTDGTLWAWGPNFNGQLGNNTRGNYYSSPIQVGSLTNWKYVATGASALCNAITFADLT